jgi:hypothetical protein
MPSGIKDDTPSIAPASASMADGAVGVSVAMKVFVFVCETKVGLGTQLENAGKNTAVTLNCNQHGPNTQPYPGTHHLHKT